MGVDAETRALLDLTRQNVKSQLRQMRTTLALLTELEKRLDRIAEGGIANGKHEEQHHLTAVE